MSPRVAAAADLPGVHALIESAYRGEAARAGWTHEADLIEGPRTSPAALAAILAAWPAERLLLFEEGDALVGCVHLTMVRPDTAYLGMVTVAPRAQAAGLGRRILAAAEGDAIDLGARTAELSVISRRAELIAWYARRGYTLTGELRPFPVSLDPPLALAVMAKPLDDVRAARSS